MPIWTHHRIIENVRNTGNGIGWHVLYGSPIDKRLALELNFFGHRSDFELVDGHDNAIGGGGDLRYLFGPRRLGVFVLGGLGSRWEDFVGDEEISPYFDVGAGVQAGGDSLQFRAEAPLLRNPERRHLPPTRMRSMTRGSTPA